MAAGRTGAPTWEALITKACAISHKARWRSAITIALGSDAADVLAAWDVFCLAFEVVLGKDDFPFQTDYTSPFGVGDVE